LYGVRRSKGLASDQQTEAVAEDAGVAPYRLSRHL